MQKLLSDGRVLAAILIFAVLAAFRALMGVAGFNEAVTAALNSIAPVSAEELGRDNALAPHERPSSGFSAFLDSVLDDGQADGRFSANLWFRGLIGAGLVTSGSASTGPGSSPNEVNARNGSQGSEHGGQGRNSEGFAAGESSTSDGGGGSAGGGGGGGGKDENEELVTQSFSTDGQAPRARGGLVAGDSETETSNGDSSADDENTTEDDGSSQTSTEPTTETPSAKASKEAVKNFQRDAFIDFPAPGSMQFVNYDSDLDDDIASIHGVDYDSDIRLSLLARRGTASVDQVKPFLIDNNGSIPNLPLAVVQRMGTPTRGQAPPGSGLQDPYVWEVRQGSTAYIISLMPRTDNQGVYLGVVQGPAGQFSSGEEHYDQLFGQIRTRK